MFFEVRFALFRKASNHLGFLSCLGDQFHSHSRAWLGSCLAFFRFTTCSFCWFVAVLSLSLHRLVSCLHSYRKGRCCLWFGFDPHQSDLPTAAFPVYLSIFLGSQISLDLKETWGTFVQWFLFPLVAAVSFRFLLSKVLSTERFQPIPLYIGSLLVPWVLSLLVFSIFACHTTQLIENPSILLPVLLAVFMFFVLTWLVGEFFAKRFGSPAPNMFCCRSRLQPVIP